MIREAAADDLPALVDMAEKFVNVAFPGEAFDQGSEAATIAHLIRAPEGIVLVSERGFIAGIVYPVHFNHGVLVGQEIGWWGDIDLCPAFESMARELGAKKCLMLALEDRKLRPMTRLYRRMGYRQIEHTFVKEL